MRKLLLLSLVLFCGNSWAQEVTNGTREIEFFEPGAEAVLQLAKVVGRPPAQGVRHGGFPRFVQACACAAW